MRINNIDELPPRLQEQVKRQLGEKKPSKFRNVRTFADGMEFDSGKEAERYGELKLLYDASEIQSLMLQVPFRLPGGILYLADFVYYDRAHGGWIVEDAKGFRTKEYLLKRKLMAEIGIEVREV